MLSDVDIRKALKSGEMHISPYDEAAMQPCSYDMKLSAHFAVLEQYKFPQIDVKRDYTNWHRKVLMDEYIMEPGELILGSTVERVTLGRCLAARVEGKSSLGRLGLAVHVTAGFIDAGFDGHVTLELINMLQVPLKIYAHMPVAQLSLFRLDTQSSVAYKGKYQHQDELPKPSQYWKNFETD